MTRQHPDGAATLALAEDTYQRQDLYRRDIVEHGVAVQRSSNTVAAIEYLKAHDIDPLVIERVLLEPHRRRTLRAH